MRFRKFTALPLILILLLFAGGCQYLEKLGGLLPSEEAETSPKDPMETDPIEMYVMYRVEDDSSLDLYKDIPLSIEEKAPVRLTDTMDFSLLKEDAPDEFLTLWDLPYVSLPYLSGTLSYEYGEGPEEYLLKKSFEEGTATIVLTKNSREALLHYSIREDHFEKRFTLHGETYIKDNTLYLPVIDLLEITGHEVLPREDFKEYIFKEQNTSYPALSLMETTEKRQEEGYYKKLLEREQEQDLNFILLGDTAIATTHGRKNAFDDLWLEHGGGYFLKGLEEDFKNADMVIANLENVFTEETKKQPNKIYNMKAHRVDYIDVLPLSGITHVNIVNNHMVDYLEAGFQETLTHLEENGIEYFGTNETYTNNIEIGNVFVESYSVFEKDGIRVGLLGYLGFNTSSVSDERIQKDIQMMREVEKVDYIVTSIHWGGQNTHEVTWKQKEMGRKLIDYGSDLVYGHHPHVLQEVEVYKGNPIYYSFGNFLFLDYKGAKDPDSVLVKVNLKKDRFGEIRAEFTHKPIYWSGHPSLNLYTPSYIENEAHLKRALGKLKISTLDPIDFSKIPEEY